MPLAFLVACFFHPGALTCTANNQHGSIRINKWTPQHNQIAISNSLHIIAKKLTHSSFDIPKVATNSLSVNQYYTRRIQRRQLWIRHALNNSIERWNIKEHSVSQLFTSLFAASTPAGGGFFLMSANEWVDFTCDNSNLTSTLAAAGEAMHQKEVKFWKKKNTKNNQTLIAKLQADIIQHIKPFELNCTERNEYIPAGLAAGVGLATGLAAGAGVTTAGLAATTGVTGLAATTGVTGLTATGVTGFTTTI